MASPASFQDPGSGLLILLAVQSLVLSESLTVTARKSLSSSSPAGFVIRRHGGQPPAINFVGGISFVKSETLFVWFVLGYTERKGGKR